MIEYLGKCLFIKDEERKIIVIGDLHLGYEESANLSGVLIGRKMLKEMLSYLDKVFKRSGKVNEIIFLGDIKHNFGKILKQEKNDFIDLINHLWDKTEKVILIKGNHDSTARYMIKNEKIELKDYYICGKYCFLHGDRDFLEIYNKKIKYWIMGHIHPAIRLRDNVKNEKYKCYLVGKYKERTIIIVPSFIDYFQGSDFRDEKVKCAWNLNLEKFKVKVVGEGLEIFEFGTMN